MMRRLSFTLFILIAVLLAVLSVGGGVAGWSVSLYSSWPVMALWCVMAVVSVCYMVRVRLWRRPVTALMHLALTVILAGAMVTHLTSTDNEVHLRADSTEAGYTLVSCDILTYPATDTPCDYTAVIADVTDTAMLSLNHPAMLGDSRLLLKSFDSDAGGVTVSVSRDPWGRALTCAGYIMLGLTMLLYFFMPGTGWRKSLSRVRHVGALILVSLAGSAPAGAAELNADNAGHLMQTAVFHDGRICPLGTLARDFTVTVTGSGSIDGYSSAEVFTGFLFDFGTWRRLPVIKVKDKHLRQLLGAQSGRCSYEQWFEAVTTGAVDLDDAGTQRLSGTDIARFEAVNMLVSGALLKLFPVTEEGTTVWYAPTDRLPSTLDADRWMFVRKYLGLLNERVLTGDSVQVDALLDALDRYQRSQAADIPSARRLDIELTYNRLASSPLPLITAVACALIMFGGLFIAPRVGRRRRVAGIIAASLMCLWMVLLAAMRWYVSRHVPLANGYDTMMLMGLIAASVALIFNRHPLLLSGGLLLSALAMAVAAMSGSGASVTPLMPVLSSPLLSVHVLLVMSSYALFALMALISVYGLTAGRAQAGYYAAVSRVMLYPALMALGAGIFVGAVWADVSWGRYWGWDPKEVWALITFMVYALPAHRDMRLINDTPVHYLRYTLAALACVAVTYLGVNCLLGGLHSYA